MMGKVTVDDARTGREMCTPTIVGEHDGQANISEQASDEDSHGSSIRQQVFELLPSRLDGGWGTCNGEGAITETTHRFNLEHGSIPASTGTDAAALWARTSHNKGSGDSKGRV